MSLPPSANAGPSTGPPLPPSGHIERVYFSRESGTWREEQDDGTELEYDSTKGAWIPLVDEDILKQQQAAYSVAGVDEEAPAAPVQARENKKRKQPVDYTSATGEESSQVSIKRGKTDKKEKPATERKSKNTAVYVTGLPVDAELDEIVQCFSKYGVLEEDDEGDPKVKMYAREDGSFSGEALVVYFKEDSVTLAENILDETELRLGDASTRMHVAKADFAHKAHSGEAGGKPRKVVDKKKASKRIVKMQKKLEEWDDEDGFGPSREPEEKTNALPTTARVVVLKHMFTLEELEEDATLLLDLKEDVREECSSLGDVTNVVLYDKEEEGVMTVKFRDPISAQACIVKMHGRFFAGRRIEASFFTGKQRFRRSGTGDDAEEDSEDAEKKRLENFTQWLMSEGD